MSFRGCCRAWLVAAALVPGGGCARVEGDQDAERIPAFVLSAGEIRLARRLVEQELNLMPGSESSDERIFHIKTELLPDSQAESRERLVNVIHYRYRGDETILTTVDLARLEILKSEAIPHFPTALAAEELGRASELARNDERLQPLFASASPPLVVEGRPMQAVSAHDPLLGRRVVNLLLRQSGNYLTTPRVLVDLTNEAVHVEN